MKNNNPLSTSLGTSLVILSSFFYASYGIWTKLMGDFFDGYTASALRSILVVIILVIIALVYRKFEPLSIKKNWVYILGMTITALFIWGPLYFAILQAGVGISLSVNYACLVIGMIFFGCILAGEKFTKDKAFSAVFGIIGLALIFSPTSTSLGLLALGGACLSGFAASANVLFSKKIHYSSTQSTIMMWTTSIVANLLMAFILGKSIPAFHGQIEWGYLVIFAVASVIASWALVRGIKLIDAGIAGILGLLEIVVSVIFGVILFSEKPTISVLLGVGIIIVASAIPLLRERKLKKK